MLTLHPLTHASPEEDKEQFIQWILDYELPDDLAMPKNVGIMPHVPTDSRRLISVMLQGPSQDWYLMLEGLEGQVPLQLLAYAKLHRRLHRPTTSKTKHHSR
ncbi:hypothetical protein Tco_0002852 [Tanacetum coccineum]